MANFIFNWASAALNAATLDLSVGNYYAHLVTITPALGNSTIADLALPTVSNYTSTPLTGLSYNATRWTFDSFNFAKYNFVSAPTGVVICKQTGPTPAITDGIICYSDFNNSIEQTISLQVGTYVVNLQFGSNGAINFAYKYQYASGAYSTTELIPKGLIYLLGSKNDTTTFANPFNNTNSAATQGTASDITNRDIGFVGFFASRYALNFGATQIKPVNFGVYHRDSISKTIELWATNNLPSFTAIDIDNASFWTLIGSIANPVTGWNFISVTNNTYWKYLKLKSSDNSMSLSVQEVEIYSSQALSPTVNFI